MTVVAWEEAGGVSWCTQHHGIINEDSPDGRCDMFDPRDPEEKCDEDGDVIISCTTSQLYFQRELAS